MENDANLSRLELGQKINALRLRSNISMRQLARDAGVAVSYLSGVEKNTVSPTLAMLRKILLALGTDLASFFSEADPVSSGNIFRKGQMRSASDAKRLYTFLLPRRPDIKLGLQEEIYLPGETEELIFETIQSDFCGYVLQGRLEVEIGDAPPTVLQPGDAFFVPSGMRSRGRCAGDEPARVITAMTPPRY